MIQKIPDINGKPCTVLWDTGAQIPLITHQYAKEAGFKGHPASIQISGVGSGNKKNQKVKYRVLSKKIYVSLAEFRPYGVDKITGDAVGIDLSKSKSIFSAVAGDLESPEGPIRLLIKMNHMDDAQRLRRIRG
jgi:hypothetical protein